ncbi:IS5 family transposase [Acetobacter oryzifermentans]|nr:IS5 family transposase [Acetobacter oryzifermentans]
MGKSENQGKPRVDDRRVLSGIISGNRNGMRGRDAPREYGPHKTLKNRWKRGADIGIFIRMMDGLSAAKTEPQTIMIEATYLKVHRAVSSLAKKGDSGCLIGRTKSGINTKLYAVADQNGRPLSFFMTVGQVSDYTGALLCWTASLWPMDADWFRGVLLEGRRGRPCISGRISRGKPVKYDKRKYKRCNRIEIMFGRLKDWQWVATRYGRCPTVFFPAICLAKTVMFWL